ncbi:MATE family efflux transporter [Effusibacillus pohliae]|uniref:MATE family efflux transporter n=1 Tax=Effusibacillus pohliae TaxID=232270 RepID=UPI000370182D|nr:MATE family efflux transporter [Effusibacillus pohliae]
MSETSDRRPTGKLRLFALTWPILIEFLLHMLMGSADTFMLSHVSDEAVAAVGVANQLVFLTIILFGFVATGTAVTVAQYLGARQPAKASRIAAISVTINLLFGVAVSVLLVLFREQFLHLLQLPPNLLKFADAYLTIVGGTIFVQALLVTVSSIVRSHGFTGDAMFVSLGMNLLHVFGNYLFVFGALGVPQLGVTGVAISTAVSRTIACIVMFVLMYRRIQFPIQWSDYIRLDRQMIRQILKIGVPSAGEQLSYQTSQIMITFFITALGTAALATRVYTLNIMFFIMLFGLSLGQGTQILVGHLVGAGQKEAAYRQLLASLKWSLLITLAVASAVAVSREHLLGIFTNDPLIVQTGAGLLLFCLILEPGRTFNLVVISSLRAAGDVQFPVFMGILSMWGVSVPLSYYLGIHLHYGLLGVWMAFAADEWLRGILMYWRWRSRAWEKKALVQAEGATSANI